MNERLKYLPSKSEDHIQTLRCILLFTNFHYNAPAICTFKLERSVRWNVPIRLSITRHRTCLIVIHISSELRHCLDPA